MQVECACVPGAKMLGDSRMIPKKKTRASFGLGRLQVLWTLSMLVILRLKVYRAKKGACLRNALELQTKTRCCVLLRMGKSHSWPPWVELLRCSESVCELYVSRPDRRTKTCNVQGYLACTLQALLFFFLSLEFAMARYTWKSSFSRLIDWLGTSTLILIRSLWHNKAIGSYNALQFL